MSNPRLSTLVDHLPVAILLLDGEGTIIYAGGSLDPILGYSCRELVCTKVCRIMMTSPAAMIHWFRTVTSRPDATLSIPLRIKTGKGAVRLFHCTLRNLLHHEAISGVLLTIDPVEDPLS
jgi:PAS domain S-box-containing protein